MLSRKMINSKVSSYLSCFVWCLIECCQFVFHLWLADTVQFLLNMNACNRKEINKKYFPLWIEKFAKGKFWLAKNKKKSTNIVQPFCQLCILFRLFYAVFAIQLNCQIVMQIFAHRGRHTDKDGTMGDCWFN